MAIKSVVIPWIGGSAVLLGYAAFAWVRQRSRAGSARRALTPVGYELAPFSDRLEHVPEELALEAEPALPANTNAATRHADLGALFLGRATSALSPFQNKSEQTSTVARKF